jgi:ABC-type dipeptide/oligopeptide/nickel transport system permease component
MLEVSIALTIGAFFMAFTSQMKIATMSLNKFWVLFILVSIFIVFKNWMRYNGKRRHILKAKLKSSHSIYVLWILPFAFIAIGVILLQVL